MGALCRNVSRSAATNCKVAQSDWRITGLISRNEGEKSAFAPKLRDVILLGCRAWVDGTAI
jgi:hypothetical protein